MIQAGERNQRVTFQRRSTTKDSFGEPDDSWTNLVVDEWVKVEPLTGREFFASQQVQSAISVRVRCRYSSALAAAKAKDRIVHGSVIYDIAHDPINVASRNVELQFMCTQHSIT